MLLRCCWHLRRLRILVELIKVIWVHENGEITVDFNFADEYQHILNYIESDHDTPSVAEVKIAI